jgi:hypothetical protein
MYVEIGGIEQWIEINTESIANPALLFLHGGPVTGALVRASDLGGSAAVAALAGGRSGRGGRRYHGGAVAAPHLRDRNTSTMELTSARTPMPSVGSPIQVKACENRCPAHSKPWRCQLRTSIDMQLHIRGGQSRSMAEPAQALRPPAPLRRSRRVHPAQ